MKNSKEYSAEQLAQLNSKIGLFLAQNRRMPSYSEICELFSVKSKDTAYRLVQRLVAAGYIDTDETGKLIPKEANFEKRSVYRTPVSFSRDLRLLGLVDAGFGAHAEEQELDRISLDEWLLTRSKEEYFMLEVKGDSMIDAGINEGDMVIVRRTTNARLGDIVIASIDGAWTIKTLREKNGKKYLEPANSNYKNLYPEQDLQISAVVTSLVRKYEK